MFLKIMKEFRNEPDSHFAKPYDMIECKSVEFEHLQGPEGEPLGVAIVDGSIVGRYIFTGNAYLLNTAGKTIDTFTPASP